MDQILYAFLVGLGWTLSIHVTSYVSKKVVGWIVLKGERFAAVYINQS